MSATTEEKTSKKVWLSYIPLVLLALTFILPLLFMLFSSLKPKDQILSDLTTFRAFLPVGDLSLDNYVGVFNRVPVARFFLNSIIVTTTIVVLGLVVNSMAGFAIARLNFRGKKILLGAIIATLIVPFETFAIPMVYLISKLPRIGFYPDGVALDWGCNNSFEVLIIPFIANAFSIYLYYSAFQSIPKELDEAAAFLNLSLASLSWYRAQRIGPDHVRVGANSVRYGANPGRPASLRPVHGRRSAGPRARWRSARARHHAPRHACAATHRLRR